MDIGVYTIWMDMYLQMNFIIHNRKYAIIPSHHRMMHMYGETLLEVNIVVGNKTCRHTYEHCDECCLVVPLWLMIHEH